MAILEAGSSHSAWDGADASGSQFIWRKYGEKSVGVRKSAVKRAYFRCLDHKAPDTCLAKKRIDRLVSSLPGEPPLRVLYIGKHNHKPRVAAEGENDADGASKCAKVEADLQRSGFESWKPEQLAREMWGDIVVHMAESAAMSESMRESMGASSLACRSCHHCGGGRGGFLEAAGHHSISVPQELEVPGESTDDDLSEGECPLTPLSVEASEPASPVGLSSPFTPGPFTPWSSVLPFGEGSSMDEEVSEMCSLEGGSSLSSTKTHSPEDVRTLVEQLQREIRGRRQAFSTERSLGGTSAVILHIVAPEELVQGVLAAVPVDASLSRASSGIDLKENDDSVVKFPPLEFADMDADYDAVSGECSTLHLDALFQPGFLLD